MEKNAAPAEKSLLSRLLCTETLIFVIGIACMVYGVADGLKEMPLFFGCCIVAGSVALHFVRKKDWDAHWAEHDRIRQAYEQRRDEEKRGKKE